MDQKSINNLFANGARKGGNIMMDLSDEESSEGFEIEGVNKPLIVAA